MAHTLRRRPQHQIKLWKTLSVGILLLFFLLTLVWLINKPSPGDVPPAPVDAVESAQSDLATPGEGTTAAAEPVEVRTLADWMWLLIFIPPMFYLAGINLEDLPARYYTLGALEPFPIPFSMMFDRAVIAMIIIFSGLILNVVFLLGSLIVEPFTWQNMFFCLYMAIMLWELPNSVRIFRFLQHVHILHVAQDGQRALRSALDAFTPDTVVPTSDMLDDPAFTQRIYQQLESEARGLMLENSPLGADQQFNLNLAIRGGEAVYQAETAVEKQDRNELAAALGIIQSLCRHGPIQTPLNITGMRDTLKQLENGHRPAPELAVKTAAG
ncbi:MAG: hypothetical protein ACFB20_08335 [Opitutales bacterium]